MSFNEYEKIVISALLHDIGKIRERTKADLEQDLKRKEYWEGFLPKKDNTFSHAHVLHSINFLREIELKDEDIEFFIKFHHSPLKHFEEINPVNLILILSDWLASGERRGRPEEEEYTAGASREPLISVFSNIKLKEEIANYYIPLKPLTYELKDLFPVREKELAIKENSYSELWNKFLKDSKNLLKLQKNVNFYDFIESLLKLLEKYTFTIPSSTGKKQLPDIPLYLHLKIVSAIASCLYMIYKEKKEWFGNFAKESINAILNKEYTSWVFREDIIISIRGDISGIQDFIYSVSSKGALRGLRARSLYIELLSEAIARKIVHEFNLTPANILLIGGGQFEIWIPYLDKNIDKIERIIGEIDKILLDYHRGKIGVAFAYQPLSISDFIEETIDKKKIRKFREKIEKSKRNVFSRLLYEEYASVFGPIEEGGEKKACKVCGSEIKGDKEKCDFCESLENLGREITSAKYLKVSLINGKSEELESKDKWCEVFNKMGISFKFEKEIKNMKEFLEYEIINSTAFINEKYALKGFRFMGKYMPRSKDNKSILDLEELSDKSEGIKRWGVLRADVDNLGEIFSIGLKNPTISRRITLSYFLSLYFKAFVNYIAEEKFKDKILVIYSGGDDLYTIGSWDLLPDFAYEIYSEFRKFTCNHPDVTLSGSIVIAPSKGFPVYEISRISGEELENKAKAREGKNAIVFLGETLPWEKFQEVKELVQKLKNLIVKYKIPKSLLHILYAGTYQEENLLKKKKIPVKRIWRIFYYFGKLVERYRKEEDKIQELEKLRQEIITDGEVFPYINICIKWADFLTREVS